ncbi:hypothetical protein WJX75_000353 [Coccomyxa subellipsoidea]|uniref:Serinc-domain-containing protein n=1 Tax=Coccomyxa subellipsoidea TaxID=248742 RepID=A0ABR2YLQ2_9CHLO
MGCLAAGYGSAKYFYFAGLALTAVLTWVLRDYASPALGHVGPLRECLSIADSALKATCVGKGVVLRISFGNFIFFAAHMLLLLCVSKEADLRRFIHTGLLPLQGIGWLGIIIACFAMPNHVFAVYGQIARVLSGFFLIIQIILLLGFIYAINEYLIEKDHVSHKIALVGATVAMYACGIVIIGFMYHFYAPAASCSLNIFFITWTLIMGIAYSIFSVTPYRSKAAGLLTSATVFIYTAVVLFNALSSEPASSCVLTAANVSSGLQIFFFFLGLAIMLISVMTSSQEAASFRLNSGSASDGDLPYRADFFHLIFMLASAYVAMVFTTWNLEGVSGHQSGDKGWISVWVKIVSQWVCVILYSWSMAAPAILKDREFV